LLKARTVGSEHDLERHGVTIHKYLILNIFLSIDFTFACNFV
jgi:hypothetical protein